MAQHGNRRVEPKDDTPVVTGAKGGRCRAAIAATVVAVALVAGCSTGGGASIDAGAPAPGVDDGASQPPAPAVETPTVAPSAEQMATLLLTPDDLKGTWAPSPDTGGDEGGDSTPCFAVAAGMFASSPATASAEYLQGTDRMVSQQAVWLGSSAADQFDEVVRSLDQCRDMSFVTALGAVDGAMGPLKFDLFGNESEAYRLLYTDLHTTLTFDIAVVRVDEVITMIWRGEVAPVPSSEVELERLAAAAVDRITRVGTSGLATT